MINQFALSLLGLIWERQTGPSLAIIDNDQQKNYFHGTDLHGILKYI